MANPDNNLTLLPCPRDNPRVSRRSVLLFPPLIAAAGAGAMLWEAINPSAEKSYGLALSTQPITIETPTPIVTPTIHIDTTSLTPEVFEPLQLPFQMSGWNLLFTEKDLLQKATTLNDDESFVISIKHSTKKTLNGDESEIIVDPSPTITVTNKGVTSFPKIVQTNGEYAYVLPTVSIDQVELCCKRTDEKNWESYTQSLNLYRDNNYPPQTTDTSVPAIHAEEAVTGSLEFEIYSYIQKFKKLGLGVWRVIMPSGNTQVTAYVDNDHDSRRNILFLPVNLLNQNHKGTTGQPGFPYLTAQAIDLLANPHYSNYSRIENHLRDLDKKILDATSYQGDNSLPIVHDYIAYYAEYLIPLLATENGYLIPDQSYTYPGSVGLDFPAIAAYALRNILPLAKHDPEKILDGLRALSSTDKEKAVQILINSFDIILAIYDIRDFNDFFPDSKELFKEIGYDSKKRKQTL